MEGHPESAVDWQLRQFAEHIRRLALSFRGQKRPVVFVGAGFSRFLCGSVETPKGWLTTTRDLFSAIRTAMPPPIQSDMDVVKKRLSLEDALECARAQQGNLFQDTLYNLFWAESGASMECIQKIKEANEKRWKLARQLFQASGTVLTTNYDPICTSIVEELKMEGANWEVHRVGRDSSISHILLKLLTEESQEPRVLLYWHGGIDAFPPDKSSERDYVYGKLDGTVLTATDFARAYPWTQDTKRVGLSRPEVFAAVARARRPIVFLGYSLRDYIVKFLLAQANLHQLGLPPLHFIIHPMYTDKNDHNRLAPRVPPDSLHEMFMTSYGVYPIFLESVARGRAVDIGDALDMALEDVIGVLRQQEEKGDVDLMMSV